jgi:hypothetical protein
MKFVALPPSELPQTPFVTLWPTVTEAIQQLEDEGYSEADAKKYYHQRLYSGYMEEGIAPEGNAVRVTGMNPRTGQPIQAYKEDASSADPTLLPSAKPINHLGEVRQVVASSPILTTSALVVQACEGIFSKVSQPRQLSTFYTQALIRRESDGKPLWKPEIALLKRAFDGSDREVRITAIACEVGRQNDDFNGPIAKTQYTGEVVDGETPYRGRAGGQTFSEIIDVYKELRKKSAISIGGAMGVRNPTSVTVVP